MLVKTLGVMLILGCSISIAMSTRTKLICHVNILSVFISALELIYSEISCMCTPTEELLEKLINTTSGAVKTFFCDCRDSHAARRDLPFALIWSRAVKDAEYLEITQNERQTLLELGNAIGRYGSEEQLRAISHAQRTLEINLKAAQSARIKLGKLYGNLSLLSGIALVIILL